DAVRSGHHAGAAKRLPIAVMLLVIMEMNGADVVLLHLLGVLFFLGRLMHFHGLRSRTLLWRRNGMILTLLSMFDMVVTNLVFLPWD
ncbi:MAPEG family protein, partial [Candidatus Erwinia dacicola]